MKEVSKYRMIDVVCCMLVATKTFHEKDNADKEKQERFLLKKHFHEEKSLHQRESGTPSWPKMSKNWHKTR